MNFTIRIVLGLSILVSFFSSCKKKGKVETLTFDYTYPDISCTVSDTANYGSTFEGWTYIEVEKIDNSGFLKLLSDKHILSSDVHSAKLKSLTLSMITPSDSSFNMFDSVFVKLGGTFFYNNTPYLSASDDMLAGQFYPIQKTGARSLTMTLTDSSLIHQLCVDAAVAYRMKVVSYPYIAIPSTTIKASITLSVEGSTH